MRILEMLGHFFSSRSTQTAESVSVSTEAQEVRLDGEKFLALSDDCWNKILSYLDESEHAVSFQVNKAFRACYKNLITAAPRLHPMQTYIRALPSLEAKQVFPMELGRINASHPTHFIEALGGMYKIISEIPDVGVHTRRNVKCGLDVTQPVVRGTLDGENREIFYSAKVIIPVGADYPGHTHACNISIFHNSRHATSWKLVCENGGAETSIGRFVVGVNGIFDRQQACLEELTPAGLSFFAKL